MVTLYVGGKPVGGAADLDRLLPGLAAANESAEVRDEAGTVVARVVPEPAAVPPGKRGPNLRLLAALDAALAVRPKTMCPVNDDDLRAARAGEMYGDPE